MGFFVLFEFPTLILFFRGMFLAVILTDRCVIVFLPSFLPFLFLLLIRLLFAWLLLLILN